MTTIIIRLQKVNDNNNQRHFLVGLVLLIVLPNGFCQNDHIKPNDYINSDHIKPNDNIISDHINSNDYIISDHINCKLN
jgi:hypothetical protein